MAYFRKSHSKKKVLAQICEAKKSILNILVHEFLSDFLCQKFYYHEIIMQFKIGNKNPPPKEVDNFFH